MSGAIKNRVVQGTLSTASVGQAYSNVKYLREIISVYSPEESVIGNLLHRLVNLHNRLDVGVVGNVAQDLLAVLCHGG